MTRIVFILALCLSCLCAHAQFSRDVAYNQILKLQSEGIDTIVTYAGVVPMYGWIEQSNQLGKIVVQQYTFVFYQAKGKGYVIRFMTYTDYVGIPGRQAISKPMLVDAELMLKWAADNFYKIREQPICSHIITEKPDSINTVYDIYYPSHTEGINLRVIIGKEQVGQDFVFEDCQHNYTDSGPENLNYSYNVRTYTYRLYSILKAITQSVQNDLKY
ncbi:hypothetical protein [Pinibacter soli]|uniref:DUF4468 domain-containing protein n=1 Tax=Pinibacter soli TaxID=3044211 RepID=A0ABT6RA96_9BACT|nr:hypothetical protein [Pinibacter soli]MDI3319494.1 hypothetical protein [Pinibacter soli]